MPKTNLIILAFVGVGVLTAFITFLFLFLTAEPNLPDMYNKTSNLTLNSGPEPLASSDFMSPRLSLYNQQPEYYLFRKKLANWDKTQVKQYWVAPKEIILDLLSKKSDKQMDDFLDKIP